MRVYMRKRTKTVLTPDGVRTTYGRRGELQRRSPCGQAGATSKVEGTCLNHWCFQNVDF